MNDIKITMNDINRIHDYISGMAITSAIYAATKLGIADVLMEKDRHINELALELKTDPESLYRLLRALASIDIFKETAPGIFSLTPMAATLSTHVENSLRGLVMMWGEPWYRDIWQGLSCAVQTGEPYFAKHFGSEFFPYIKQNENVGKEFDNAMSSLSCISNFLISQRINFSSYKHVIDIGGGQGGLLISILKNYSHLTATLFDRPETIHSAKNEFEHHHLSARCQLLAGDFFKQIPANGDLYILKHVLHGLDDQQSELLMKNISEVAKPGAKILIIEMVIPEGNAPSYSKFNDLGMMLLSKKGRERTQENFNKIISSANLKYLDTIALPMGLSAIQLEI